MVGFISLWYMDWQFKRQLKILEKTTNTHFFIIDGEVRVVKKHKVD